MASLASEKARLATLIATIKRRRRGVDLSQLNADQLAAYRRSEDQYNNGLSRIEDEDERASVLYHRIATAHDNFVPLDEDIAKLLGCYAAPLPSDATEEMAREAYRRIMEER